MKHITLVVPQDCQVNVNCLGSTYEILSRANRLWQTAGHDARITIDVAGFVPDVHSEGNYFGVRPSDIRRIKKSDMVIIPPVYEDYENSVRNNQPLIDWIRKQYKNGAELASMCSGAFLLAATGLVEGRTCSMHWDAVEKFRSMFPEVKVAEGQVITDEVGICTNGGGYSYLNLVLYMVEKIFDRTTAIYCSKIFQIDLERTTQSPFIIFQGQKTHGDDVIVKAQAYIEDNIDEKISFEKLASHLAVSRRNFDRRFIKATGNSPVEYLQRVKMEAAKKELERGRKTVSEIMENVGYHDEKTFRDVFRKITGLSPQEYRSKYNSKSAVLA